MLLNEKGWAMPFVLMLVFIMTLLGTTLWQYSVKDLKHVSIEEKKMQAHYLARSGAKITSDMIHKYSLDNFKSEYNIEEGVTLVSEFQSLNGEPPKKYFVVKIYEDDQGKIVIESIGEIDGIKDTRILEVDNRYWR